LASPETYGSDRLFVRIRMHGSFDEEMRDAEVRALQEANAPVASIELAEPSALGAEFVRWEVATAVAGALLEINPFDEPNVQQAKDATKALLSRYASDGRLPMPQIDHTYDGVGSVALSRAARERLAGQSPGAVRSLITAGD